MANPIQPQRTPHLAGATNSAATEGLKFMSSLPNDPSPSSPATGANPKKTYGNMFQRILNSIFPGSSKASAKTETNNLDSNEPVEGHTGDDRDLEDLAKGIAIILFLVGLIGIAFLFRYT